MFENYKIVQLNNLQNIKVKAFLKKYHYLENLPRSCNKIFVLWVGKTIKGVASFGCITAPNTRFDRSSTLELKRFALHPSCPKNSGSWFMSKCIKSLPKMSILSYSDPAAGHVGTLYKASNYSYLGKQKQGTSLIKVHGKLVSSQSTKYRNELNKVYIRQSPKDIWYYNNK